MEVKLDNHSLSNNTNDVLEKWKVSFSNLFQSRGTCNNVSPSLDTSVDTSVDTNPNEAPQFPFNSIYFWFGS